MKNIKSYIFAFAAATALTMPLVGCQDDFDAPEITAPVSTLTPNMTIAELKEMFWTDAIQSIDTIGVENGVADDKSYIIHGWVVSSDEAGNVFKNIVIQDGTAALTLSVNSYNLYLKYRRGQEIIMDVKGMYIGKFNGLQQIGIPNYEYGQWSCTFMAPEYFYERAQLNGFPDISKVDTLTFKLSELSSNPAEVRRLQSRLVRINNVRFTNGGVEKFSVYHSSGESQEIIDETGSALNVRTSGYCNFWNNVLPSQNLDIVGILSYYNTGSSKNSPWQLTLIDYDGCMNVGKPTASAGTETNPYTVAQAVALEKDNTLASGWVKGYIVGAVAPEVSEVKSNSDINWSADDILGQTLVIGATPETKDINDALVIKLADGSDFQKYGNLADNPGVYGKAISVKGTLQSYMGTYGVTNNSGSKSEFKIDGVEIGGNDNIPEGDGTAEKPFNATQAKAKAIANGSSSTDNVYVKGYIISGSINMKYGTGTWVIADNPAGTGDTFELFGTYNTDNGKFTDENAVKVGDLVVAVGPIFNYNGKTPEMSKGHLVSVNGNGGETPTPPSAGNVIFQESFENGDLGQFTASVETSGSWTGWRANTKPACAIANSYVNGANEAATAWLISPAIDLAKATTASVSVEQAFGFYFPTKQESFCTLNIREKGGDWKALTLTAFPEKGTGNWTGWAANTIDISAYAGKNIELGFKYVNDGKQSIAWEIKNFSITADAGTVTPGPGTGGDEPSTPTTPSGEYKGDFDTFNGGVAKASPYGTYTNATGWTAEWSIILSGSNGTENQNPSFPFIGKASTIAPCLNGNTAKVGKLTSPNIAGGIGTLSFSWGVPFKDSKISFTIKILQGGSVVASDTVTPESVKQYTAYSYSHAFNITGDCTIEIVNNSPSAAEKNGDRVAIWNLTWE